MMKRRYLVAASCVLVACGTLVGPGLPVEHLPPPFVRGPASGIELSAHVSRTVIGMGDTATLAFRARNGTMRTVTLTFSSTCQLLPFIWDESRMVHPRSGWGCGAAITSLTLPPGGTREVKTTVHGGVLTTLSSAIPLNPGRYFAYAELGDSLGRSAPVTFTVRTP